MYARLILVVKITLSCVYIVLVKVDRVLFVTRTSFSKLSLSLSFGLYSFDLLRLEKFIYFVVC